MLKQKHRLSKNNDVRMVLGRGRSFFNPFFTLKYFTNPSIKTTRFTAVVSTKVSKLAVHRNRIKRLAREFFRLNLENLPKGDYVLIAKPAVAKLEGKEVQEAVKKLFSTAKLLK